MLEQPGGGVGHAQVALELQRRDVVLGLRHQVHGEEPSRQRELAGFEDGAADQAALLAAGTALKVQPILAPELAVPATLAARAGKALGPAPSSNQGCHTAPASRTHRRISAFTTRADTAPCSAPWPTSCSDGLIVVPGLLIACATNRGG